MDRYLIINADDFGMCRSANTAVQALLASGGITSSTVMMPCRAAAEACRFAARNPQYAIGVHLTFTSEWSTYRWGPVGKGAHDSLLDKDGFMYHESDEFEYGADLTQVEAEIRAQLEAAKALGLNPSHIDNHMGSLYGIETGRTELLELTFRIAAEYGLPFRFPLSFTEEQYTNTMLGIKIDRALVEKMIGAFAELARAAGIATPDYLMPHDWNGPQKDSYESFREHIYERAKTYPAGVTETYFHPAVESDELKDITGSWEHRVWENRLLSDPATRQHFEACGIKLINYRDLAKMRKA